MPDQPSQPPGFLAVPKLGAGSPVLVLHAWWGLNDTIRAFCGRLAEAGYTAFAPDLYHGRVADTVDDAGALAQALDANAEQAKADVLRACEFITAKAKKTPGGAAVIGFSLGAYYSLNLAATSPDLIRSVVLFYGTGSRDAGKSKANYLGHFAEKDPFETQADVDGLAASLAKAGRSVTFHVYPGTGHWFFEPDRAGFFNPQAAALAWERTLSFIKPISPFQTAASLETGRLIVRGIDEKDIADMLVMNQDDEVLKFLPYPKWQSLEDGMAWLARVRKIEAAGTAVQLAILDKASGRCIGACVLFQYHEASGRAEIGFAMARAYWGKGIMAEALSSVITHAFAVRGLRRLEAEANPLNAGSCRLLERLGFTSEGLLRKRWQAKGVIYDSRIFGLLSEEWKAPAPKVP